MDIDSGNSRLLCLANTPRCCRRTVVGGEGTWYFPDGTEVPGGDAIPLNRDKENGFVALPRLSSTGVMTGLFRCEIEDTMDIALVGIYRSGEGELIILKEYSSLHIIYRNARCRLS